ncbi:four-carbon acid sugar kinase family protein [Diaminobutyricimonas sp. TR449]|uniref:four-carbon acid sugar kinase family protein n=1 Tax=Diaminobutyricimonas sp. TR449 TaxID=2708076 RepID=UPI00141DD37F|nr:four-carbon acid sugar kinase family protein [Diaminobutyricimonas sp. TR449]
MKTIVLDDDPTGTQSAAGVTVLLKSDADLLTEALRLEDSVYVQTNSRAISEESAVALVRSVREDGLEAAQRLGHDVRFVLRGDSTLRGHVFAESEVFSNEGSIMVFVPAFPAGGRITVDGMHLVTVDGVAIPAHETEYAADPVFPFSNGRLVDYVAEKSSHPAVHVPLDAIRDGRFPAVLGSAPAGSVVVPDVSDDDDIAVIAAAITAAQQAGRDIVVRSAAPLAAALAGVVSDGFLSTPLVTERRRTLLVCGSHTVGASRQMEPVIDTWGDPVVVPTADALSDSTRTADRAARAAAQQLDERGLAMIMSERNRLSEHNSLDHGSRVMESLTLAVRAVAPRVDVVIAKGGITSADVARIGLGAESARVLGQVLPGISVWDLTAFDGHQVLYVVVPGNVGGPETLTDVLAAVGF